MKRTLLLAASLFVMSANIGADRKVRVCHVPPGNPLSAHEIVISENALPAHVPLHGGDYVMVPYSICVPPEHN
jgi:hypothetical protein